MKTVESLRIKIYADGADRAGMLKMSANPLIKGFTTNPTLMRKAGVTDYEAFARDILAAITDRPISFEVFSDDLNEMEQQARHIASWGENVYVKIPITNSVGRSSIPLIRRLANQRVKQNVTAVFTLEQVRAVCEAVEGRAPVVVSVFAGRIADTGVDPVPLMTEAKKLVAACPRAELLWASPRELLNIFQADEVGCDIITVTHDVLAKLALVGKDMDEFSLETVKMFREDAVKAGFALHRRSAAAA
jgi:transaldolase